MAQKKTVKRKTNKAHYGFWNFALDALMTIITGGLWLIWVFVREMRNLRK